ncbi:MAG: DUF1843 domain-containing protein [Thermoanaerobaculia bacterium]
MAGYGGGSRPRPLYGVWIDEAISSNDPEQMKAALSAAKTYFGGGGIHTLYGVIINQAISSGASKEELQSLLSAAEQTGREDLQGAISKLRSALGS